MGTILTSYGDPGYEHEGYAAYVLYDGTLTGTWGPDTRGRMSGERVAACDCGWTGTTRYPGADADPLDEQAEAIALAEWEHTHARPVLEQAQHRDLGELHERLRSLTNTYQPSPAPTAPRRELAEHLEAIVGRLTAVTALAERLHAQAQEQTETTHT